MGYMTPYTQSLYDKIRIVKTSEAVFELWNDIARQYFTYDSGLLERKHPDLLITDISNNRVNVGVVIAVPKKFEDTPSSEIWKEAVDSVTAYLTHLQHNQLKRKMLWTIVAIGRYARFFALDPDKDAYFFDCSGTNDEAFDVKKNEKEIDVLLSEWVVAASE